MESNWNDSQKAAVSEQLARLEASSLFISAARLSKFLRYIIVAALEGEAARLNQSAIAIDVFERGADFDPAIDSIVRVEAGRLRSKLREYYDTEGSSDRIRIELPKGTYAPAIHLNPATVEPPAQTATPKPAQEHPAASTNLTIALTVIGVLVLALGYFVYQGQSDEQYFPPVQAQQLDKPPEAAVVTAPPTAQPAIAVLPFVNMSSDPEQEYFSDGISEEILNGLTKVEDLLVAARTSSFYFKGKDVDLETIAEKLRVNHVLEGSVRKSGDRLRITAQLIKTDDGFRLWSESYDREMTDIFAVQEEIAKAVVDALKVELGVVAGSTLVDIGTSSREAYDWYLRGKDALVAGTAEGYKQGVEYFERAIKLDPNYADAHAHLAFAYIWQHPFTLYGELASSIKQAYSRTFELESSHQGAMCAQAYDRMVSDSDWAEAGKLFQAATPEERINNICAAVYSYFYASLGRFNEGIDILRNAARLDPLNLNIKNDIGFFFGLIGDWEESIRSNLEVIEVAPDHVFALLQLTEAYIWSRQLGKAESMLRRLEISDDPAAYQFAVLLRVQLEVVRGEIAEAQSIYDEGRRVAESGINVSPALWLHLGFAAGFLGHLDDAIAHFTRAFDSQAQGVMLIRTFVTSWPTFTQGYGPALIAHPDFQVLLAKMNLDDESIAALEKSE